MTIHSDILDSDMDLIHACREGVPDAWDRVLEKYERLVYSVPLHYGATADDAADIAQVTFTILLENLDSLREDSNLRAWLCTVARRYTWRVLKSSQHETLDDEEAEFMHKGAELMGQPKRDDIEYWELVSWLQQGLGKLGGRCQELLRSLYFDEQQPEYATIARRMSMPVGSIGPTRARCLAHLKQILEESK